MLKKTVIRWAASPYRRSEADTAARLNEQLDDQGRDFVNNPAKNKISKDAAQLSNYFDWYKGDVTSITNATPKRHLLLKRIIAGSIRPLR